MGMSVSLDLLAAIYPIAISMEALEHDLHQLEAARFMRPTDAPGTWFMTHVRSCAYPSDNASAFSSCLTLHVAQSPSSCILLFLMFLTTLPLCA